MTQMDLQGDMPGEISQAEKDKYRWISFTREIQKKPDSWTRKTDQRLLDVGVGWAQEMGEGIERHRLLVIR